jgi:hypothetical protein
MNATALYRMSRADNIPFDGGEMSVGITAVGFEVGTGGAATLEYVRERGNKGYPFAAYDWPKIIDAAERTPAENLERIRAVLKTTVTDLAEVLSVSRQALYAWLAGKPIASENGLRLADIARAADVFAIEGLTGTSQDLRRPIRNGKNFFDLVREGGSAEDVARTLIDIVRTELRQRRALKNRLAVRKRPSRETFEEVGAPMLDERG